MAPSTPSSGAGATFTEIDLARWTLPQCRAKCWALGLPEYGLLSQLRSRLSRWRTTQLDATGPPVTTPPAGEQPPPGAAPLAPAPFAAYAPPLPPRPTTVSSRRAPVANGRRTPPQSRSTTTDRSRGSSVQASELRTDRRCKRPRVALDDIHASATTQRSAADEWTSRRAAGGAVFPLPGRSGCQWRAQRRPRRSSSPRRSLPTTSRAAGSTNGAGVGQAARPRLARAFGGSRTSPSQSRR